MKIAIKEVYIIEVDGVPAGAMYGCNGNPIKRGGRQIATYPFDRKPNRFKSLTEARQVRQKLFEWLLLKAERNYQKWNKGIKVPKKMALTVPNMNKINS